MSRIVKGSSATSGGAKMDISTAATKMFSAIASQQDTRSSNANTMLSTAITYMTDENYSQAVQALKASISYNPQSTDAYNYLAQAYLQLGNNQEAIKAYKTSLQLDYTQSDSHLALANVYAAEGNTVEAEKSYKAAIQTDTTDEVAPYSYGLFLLNNDRASESISQFLKSDKLSPYDGNVYYALGSAYNKLERYSDAADALNKAISLKGSDFYAAQNELGYAYAGLNDKESVSSIIDLLNNSEDATAISYADTLEEVIAQPKLVGVVDSGTTLLRALGASTPVYFLDIALATPNTSKDFTIQLQFDSEMDVASVMDTTKWSISKGSDYTAGYYNNGVYSSDRHDAHFTPTPKQVVYDPTTLRATVTFSISQNDAGNATIDPSRLLFKFMGKDVNGKTMDQTADQYDSFGGVF